MQRFYRTTLTVSFLFTLFISTFTIAQNFNVDHLGSLYNYWGYAKDVKIQDETAYIMCYGSGVNIMDISDLSAPVEIGDYHMDGLLQIQIFGSYLYLCDSNGFQIVDVSVPESPVFIGECELLGYTRSMAVDGDFAYVSYIFEYDEGLQIIDISDPTNPEIVGSCAILDVSHDIEIINGVAFVAIDDFGLQIVDLSNPSNPQELSSIEFNQGSSWIDYNDGYIYSVAGDYGMYVIDVNDPANPSLAAGPCWIGPICSEDIITEDDFAYVSCTHGTGFGMVVVDISDPSTPHYQVLLNLGIDPTAKMDMFHEFVFIARGESGFTVVSVETPTAPYPYSDYVPAEGIISDAAICGNYAYIIDGAAFKVIDVSNPAEPAEVACLDSFHNSTQVLINDTFSLVSTDSSLVYCISINSPQNPVLIDSVSTGLEIYDLYLHEDYLYVTGVDIETYYPYLSVINFENPDAPYIEANSFVSSIYTRFAATDGYVHLVNQIIGEIDIYDVSDLTYIFEAGSYGIGTDNIIDLEISYGYAYILDTGTFIYPYSSFLVYDLTDPIHPQLSGSFEFDDMMSFREIIICDERAYIAAQYDGLFVVDIIDPNQPELLGYYNTSGVPAGICADSDYIYTAETYHFDIYQYNDGTGIAAPPDLTALPGDYTLTCYPNPFNPETVIEFGLPQAGKVEILVFNLLGRQVAELQNGFMAAGYHTVTFDAGAMSSGVYFYMMKTAGHSEVKKMLLVK